jgi:hypothetical protein
MDAIIGTNAKVEVQSSLGSPITITDIATDTAGDTIVTATNSLSAGDVVVFSVSGGMVQLDGQACRVAAPSGGAFTAEGVDITGYDAWTSGTCTEVTGFETLASARSITMPSPTPNKLDKTVLIDRVKQYEYGLPDAPDGSITCLFNPGGTAEGLITHATNTNSALVARFSFDGGNKHTVFNANWSGGAGFSLGQNAVGESTIAFTPIKQVIHYAS